MILVGHCGYCFLRVHCWGGTGSVIEAGRGVRVFEGEDGLKVLGE